MPDLPDLWRLETGDWRLGTGDWGLGTGDWRLERGIVVDLHQGTADLESIDDVALADRMNAGRRQIVAELQKRIVGQGEVIELVLQTLFVGGNSLIVGVPGL